MIQALPAYVSPFFIATTFLTVGFLFYAVKTADTESWPSRLILFCVPFWMLFQAAVSLGGFYQETSALPSRIFAFAALPAVLFLSFIAFAGGRFIDRLSLRTLTLLSIIRVPVEFALLLLYRRGLVPEAMTFEGTNFDILSGISAPIMAWLAFRGGRIDRPLLIIWNVAALLLLINIVTTAVIAFPSPFQRIAFDQPNKAIMFFPFVWLPSVIVPIVFFSHLVSLRRLLTKKTVASPI